MPENTQYRLTATTLSPLHVGSGERLQKGYDFIERQNAVWVANQMALLGAILDEQAEGTSLEEAAARITGKSLGDLQRQGWLRDEHFDPTKKLFRYRLAGATGKENAELHEQIKDVFGKPYLPGSSLKGALRTILAWQAVRQRKITVTAGRLGNHPKFAGLPIERELFGADPNHDLLRAVQVTDSATTDIEHLVLATVHLAPAGANRDKLGIDVEAIRPGTAFEAALTLDNFLLHDRRAASELRFGDRAVWLTQFVEAGRLHARQRLLDEIKFYQAAGGPPATLAFYASLAKMLLEGGLSDDEFLLQLGWGAGWDSKTLDGELRRNPDEFEKIVDKYKLDEGPNRKKQASARPSAEAKRFPVTRKLAAIASLRLRDQPLGWLRIRVTPI